MHCICLCQQKYLCDQASRWCKSGESACQALEMWKVVVTNLAGPGIKQGLPHLILLYSIKHTSLPTFQMKFLYFNTNGITKQLLSRCVYFVFFILYSGNLPFIDKLLIILQTSFNPSDITLNWEHVKVVNPLFYILTNPFFVPIPLCDPIQQFTEEKVLILSRAFRKIWSRV